MGFWTGLLLGALGIPAGDTRSIFDASGLLTGQVVGRFDGGLNRFDRSGRFEGQIVRAGSGFQAFDRNGRYEGSIAGHRHSPDTFDMGNVKGSVQGNTFLRARNPVR